MTQVERQIIETISSLTEEQQAEVLRFAQQVRSPSPSGISGKELVRRLEESDIYLPDEDAEEMKRAIEEGCENIDINEW